MNTSTPRYAFIGAGNMARAIITGMINNGGIAPQSIIASTASQTSADQLQQEFNIQTTTDNNQCLVAEVIVLAVKPQILVKVLKQINQSQLANKLIISVIAGQLSQTYADILGTDIRLIRTMPNTPALIGQGMTGLYANANTDDDDKQIVSDMMRCVGQILWVTDESGIDYVNAISGSGPAYFYYFIKSLADSGEKLGLSYQDASQLAIQTAIGAAMLTQEKSTGTPESIQALIDQVTSKGGTTYEAIQAFEQDKFADIVDHAVNQCYRRALALGKQ